MMESSVSTLQRTEEISSLNEKLEKEIGDVELPVQSYKQKLLGFDCQDDGIINFGSWISFRFGVIEEAVENLTQELDDAYYRKSGRGLKKKVVDCDNSEERVSLGIQSSSVSSSSSFEFRNPMNCSNNYNEKLVENIDGEVSLLGISKNEVGDDSQKSKVIFHASHDFEQLRMRLQMHEEDYQLMKKEFVMGVEERCELLTEISSQFHIIQQHLN